MLPRVLMTATFAGLLMAGLAWAPPADAWGRPSYHSGCYSPRFSTVTPFGSPYYPRALVVPRSPWTPSGGYWFYGYRPSSPGFYPRVSPYPSGERPWYHYR